MSQSFTIQRIGTIHTPWRSIADCPRNGRQPDPAPFCSVRVFPEFLAGLQSLDGFSHLILLYWMHATKPPELVFTPPFDTQPRGIFATRGPRRPNPIALSVVAFDGMDGPDCLKVRYLDCIDGTPLLDIKPYVPDYDNYPVTSCGWVDTVPEIPVVADARFEQPPENGTPGKNS